MRALYLDFFFLGHLGEFFFLREEAELTEEFFGLVFFGLLDALEVEDLERGDAVDDVVAVVGVLVSGEYPPR